MALIDFNKLDNPLTLEFRNIELRIVDFRGKPWVTAEDAGRCLGYERPRKNTLMLYNRNAEFFGANETAEIELLVPRGGRSSDPKLGSDELKKSTPKEHMVKQKVRIFSLRGLNRLGLYARTEQGNLFHNWVLDLLEGRKFQNSMIQDHRKLVAFFFERRPNWRKLAELFVLRCYSLEYMALNAHMSYASARRAVRVMHARGLISSYDYESGMRNAKLAKPHFEKIVLAQAANAAKQRDMFTTEAGAA